MRFGVVVFPGSNCDADVLHALTTVMGQEAEFVWHQTRELKGYDCLVLPGGFSYGDYLRTGAIARFAPVMEQVCAFAEGGGLVLGICNGFQILLEAGLLPGAMTVNDRLRFVCQDTFLKVENNRTPFSNACRPGEILRLPVAHGEGNYFAPEETLAELERNGQIVFRYCNGQGDPEPAANPNGSRRNIAGLVNRRGNVLGMMPHPERAMEALLGSTDGRKIFQSIINYWAKRW